MNTEFSSTGKLSAEWLHRYIEMRRKLDVEANSIHSITSMLALLEFSGDDRIQVDPVALGEVNQSINSNIPNIWEILDDFIYIVQARLELEQLEKISGEQANQKPA